MEVLVSSRRLTSRIKIMYNHDDKSDQITEFKYLGSDPGLLWKHGKSESRLAEVVWTKWSCLWPSVTT